MRSNERICPIVILAFFWQSMALAQTCSHAQGYWQIVTPPNEGSILLNQSGTTLTGGGYPLYCASPWPLSNGLSIAGAFGGTVTNPLNPDEFYFCYPRVDFGGTVQGPGCDTASGTYSNIAVTNAPFTWQKACDLATGETTALGSWDQTFHTFLATVQGSDGPNFGGRGVQETDYAPAVDTCYFSTSMVPEATGVTNPGIVYVNTINVYGDKLGWFPDAVTCYRQQEVTPCAATIYQRMVLHCNTIGPVAYKDNVLILRIFSLTVRNERDGVISDLHAWP